MWKIWPSYYAADCGHRSYRLPTSRPLAAVKRFVVRFERDLAVFAVLGDCDTRPFGRDLSIQPNSRSGGRNPPSLTSPSQEAPLDQCINRSLVSVWCNDLVLRSTGHCRRASGNRPRYCLLPDTGNDRFVDSLCVHTSDQRSAACGGINSRMTQLRELHRCEREVKPRATSTRFRHLLQATGCEGRRSIC